MEERTIQSVPVMPFALMLACISAVMGLIVGIFYAAIFGAIFSGLPSEAVVLSVCTIPVCKLHLRSRHKNNAAGSSASFF